MDTYYEFEDYRLDANVGALLSGEGVTPLQPQTCELLRAFLNRPKQVLSREFLMNAAWEGGSLQTNDPALNYQISILREKLGDDPQSPRFIETVRKKGFRFLKDVRKTGLGGKSGELYEKGRHFFLKSTAPDITKAIECYQKVIDLKADYVADAYAGMAESYILLGTFAHQNAPAKYAMEQARDAAHQALALKPAPADAHAALASIAALYDWRWTKALEHFDRALRLPGNPLVKPMVRAWYGNCLAGRGESERARVEIGQARTDFPTSPVLAALSGRVAYLARDYTLAIQECDEAIGLEKHLYLGHVFKGHVLTAAGQHEEAMRCFVRACELTENNPVCVAEVARLHGLQGNVEACREILRQTQVVANSRYASPHVFAVIHLGLDLDKALDFLVKTFEGREAWLVFLTTDPIYDPLRSRPRFVELVRRVGFAPTNKR